MRTTITLDPDVADVARAMARASGRRLGSVVSELARRGLRSTASPTAAAPPDSHQRFATFPVRSGAPAPSLSAIRRAWEEST
ncbi:MAG: hypothetical protein FJ399_05795 [Verrucomicrobia bacterium]|nr:hypothetical protein [Verrucomicrobiota bacterium]